MSNPIRLCHTLRITTVEARCVEKCGRIDFDQVQMRLAILTSSSLQSKQYKQRYWEHHQNIHFN
jgi:hypothetical protein